MKTAVDFIYILTGDVRRRGGTERRRQLSSTVLQCRELMRKSNNTRGIMDESSAPVSPSAPSACSPPMLCRRQTRPADCGGGWPWEKTTSIAVPPGWGQRRQDSKERGEVGQAVAVSVR